MRHTIRYRLLEYVDISWALLLRTADALLNDFVRFLSLSRLDRREIGRLRVFGFELLLDLMNLAALIDDYLLVDQPPLLLLVELLLEVFMLHL